jgi:hypothetical protein
MQAENSDYIINIFQKVYSVCESVCEINSWENTRVIAVVFLMDIQYQEAASFTVRSTPDFRNTNWMEPKTVTWLFDCPYSKAGAARTVVLPSEQSCDHYWFDLVSVPKIRSTPNSKLAASSWSTR